MNLSINEKKETSFHFNPETIFDQLNIEIPIKNLKFSQTNVISFEKETKNSLPNNFYYDLSLKYYLPANQIPPRDENFQ